MMMKYRYLGALVVTSAFVASSLAPAYAAEDEGEAGNNLSYPLLWAEAEGRPALPGTFGEELFDGLIMEGKLSPDSTETCFGAVQKDPMNQWQAENLDAGADHSVTTIDWGDNIEVKDWKIGSPVRVETSLFDDTLPAPMSKYDMCWISGRGSDEVWGAKVNQLSGNNITASVVQNEDAMVFTAGARLTIQRVTDPTNATWDAIAHRWVGSGTTEPVFNSAVHEKTSDGPGSYGTEINVQGKLIYGFNWDTTDLFNGEYRITFSLDGPTGTFAGTGTSLQGATILASEEAETPVLMPSMGPGGGGGHGGGGGGHGGGGGGGGGESAQNVAVVLGDLNLTYIDVGLSGGEDAPPSDGGGTTPPTDSGVAPPPPSGTEPVAAPGGSMGTDPVAQAPIQITLPEFAQAQARQTARIRAPKNGNYKSGRTLVLTPKPVKTSAGVTVRWRVTKKSMDNCEVRKRKGKVSLKLIKPGTCRVIAYAPAPSPDYLRFRDTRTYRVVR